MLRVIAHGMHAVGYLSACLFFDDAHFWIYATLFSSAILLCLDHWLNKKRNNNDGQQKND